MAAGLGVLGLAPRDFWALTIPELEAALRGRFGRLAGKGDAPARRDLKDLMRQFPD